VPDKGLMVHPNFWRAFRDPTMIEVANLVCRFSVLQKLARQAAEPYFRFEPVLPFELAARVCRSIRRLTDSRVEDDRLCGAAYRHGARSAPRSLIKNP
jgi:hypothetical protein